MRTAPPGLRPALAPHDLAPFGTIPALALIEALFVEGVAARFRWPNEVVIDGRKVGATVVEFATDGDRIEYVIFGIEVNLNGGPRGTGSRRLASTMARRCRSAPRSGFRRARRCRARGRRAPASAACWSPRAASRRDRCAGRSAPRRDGGARVDRASLTAALGELADGATSVREETGHELDRNDFAATVLNLIDKWLLMWEAGGREELLAARRRLETGG